MKQYEYEPHGVCSGKIYFCIEDGRVANVRFESGCEGNLEGICRLIEGMSVEDVIERLQGIDCEGKGTSCPDQLARALKKSMGPF